MGKPHRAIFHEFKGGSSTPNEVEGSGDVKYHLGASSDREFDGNRVHLSLTANPSHLEIVNPVVLGKVAAKQDQHGATREDRTMVMPLLISGDAAFAGQGVIAEMLRPLRIARAPHRRLRALHRQQPDRLHHLSARFTIVAVSVRRRQDDRGADLPRERRRSGGGGVRRQGSDRVPPEVPASRRHRHVLLPPFRTQRRRRAVVHPAADVQGDPQRIRPTPRSTPRSSSARTSSPRARSRRCARIGARGSTPSSRRARAQGPTAPIGSMVDGPTSRRRAMSTIRVGDHRRAAGDAAEDRREDHVAPEGFHAHRTIRRFLEIRHKAIRTGQGIDWATGEALAFCSCSWRVVRCGCPARTPNAAHSRSAIPVLVDQENEDRYIPFNHLGEEQARFEVINSMLSEEAVLGFEYGYSLAEPSADAVGGAVRRLCQRCAVVFDQFVSSGERKWLRMSGLCLPAAARLRRTGPGALLGAPRALPADGGRGQHADRELHHAGQLFPRSAPAIAS